MVIKSKFTPGQKNMENRINKIKGKAGTDFSLCYVKVKGQNPLFYVFYLFSLLAPHFCLTKTKILHLQFLAVLFQNL